MCHVRSWPWNGLVRVQAGPGRGARPADGQGSTIPPGSLSIEYYTYYIVLRINTVSIMGTYLLVLLVLTY